MTLDQADVDFMLDLMRELIAQTLAKADAAPRLRGIPGIAVDIDGADVYVLPDDDPSTTLQATLYATGVSVGDSVLLLAFPAGGAFVIGAQP